MDDQLRDKVVQLARECLCDQIRAGIVLDRVELIVDIEASFRRGEEKLRSSGKSSQTVIDRIKAEAKGKFAVHFPYRLDEGVCMDPSGIVVTVEPAKDSAKIRKGL